MIGSPARYNRCCKSSANEERIRIHGVIFAAESTACHMDLLGHYRGHFSKIALDMFDSAEATRGFEYVRATRERAALTIRLLGLGREIDFLSLPTLPALTPDKSAGSIRSESRDIDFTMALIRYTCFFDHTGQPVVAMPSSVVRPGTAVSIQLIGAHDRYAETVAFASRLERTLEPHFDFRVTP